MSDHRCARTIGYGRLVLAIAGVVSGMMVHDAAAATKTWDGTSGDYRSAHWSGAVPAAGDLLIMNAGNITSAAASPGGEVVLSPGSTDGQSLSIGGGSLQLGATAGDGVLRVDPSGSLTLSSGSLGGDRLKINGGSFAQTGGTTSFTDIDYLSGTMELSGGTLGWTYDKRLTISGMGTTPAMLVNGTGKIDCDGQLYIGSNGGSGAFTATGAGVGVDVRSNVYVGWVHGGTPLSAPVGRLSVLEGADFSFSNMIAAIGQYGGDGELTIRGDGTTFSGGSTIVGWSRDHHSSTGYAASTGKLTLDSGATMTMQYGVMIGVGGGIGQGTISGVGTKVVTDGLNVGTDRYQNNFSGPAGEGSLVLSDGAVIQAGSVSVGHGGGIGTMLVSGSGTAFAATNGWITVGSYRSEYQGVDAGAGDGTLQMTAGAQASYSACMSVGSDGGKGIATIEGPGTRVYGTSGWGAVYVGNGRRTVNDVDHGGSVGELYIRNGARFDTTTGSFPLVFNSMIGAGGGTGSVAVSGTGSLLNVHAAQLMIGYDRPVAGGSTGGLLVSDGGQVRSVGAVIGGKGGQGTVILSGETTLWQSDYTVWVGSDGAGNAGSGAVCIGDRSAMSILGELNIAAGSLVDVDSGTLTATTIRNEGTLEFRGGTIDADFLCMSRLLVSGSLLHTITGDLTLSGGTLSLDVRGMAMGGMLQSPGAPVMLSIAGTLDLGGSGDVLEIIGGQPGQSYMLSAAGGMSGSFDSVTPGYGISQEGGNIVVSAVPEPSLGLALLAGGAGLVVDAATALSAGIVPGKSGSQAGTLWAVCA